MYWSIGAAAVAALIDWISVWREDDRTEAIAKPAVMLFLLVAVLLADQPSLATALVALAVVMSLVGDVLLLPRFDNFIGGLAAFLLGHVFYTLSFLRLGVDPAWAVGGAGVALFAIIFAGRRIVEHATLKDETLGRAVLVYILVISLMLTFGVGVSLPVGAGALLFAASDAILGWNRFVAPLAHGRLLTHVPYHVGQGLIVLGLLTQ